MSVNINLADKRNPNQAKKERAKKIRALAVALLIITAFSAVIIFILDYRFSASYLSGQEQELQSELEPFGDVSAQLFIVNTKLTDINKIINQRNNFGEDIKIVFPNESEDVEVEEFNISENGIQIDFIATSLTPIDDYINRLISIKEVGRVTLNRLTLEDDGYNVELIILL